MYRKTRSDRSIFSIEATLNIIILVLLIAVIIYIIWKDFVSKDKVDLKKLRSDVDSLLTSNASTLESLEVIKKNQKSKEEDSSKEKDSSKGKNSNKEDSSKEKDSSKGKNSNKEESKIADKPINVDQTQKESNNTTASGSSSTSTTAAGSSSSAAALKTTAPTALKTTAEQIIDYLNNGGSSEYKEVISIDDKKSISELNTILESAKKLKTGILGIDTSSSIKSKFDLDSIDSKKLLSGDNTRLISGVTEAVTEKQEMTKLVTELKKLVEAVNTWLNECNTNMNKTPFTAPTSHDPADLKKNITAIEGLKKGDTTKRDPFLTEIKDKLINKIVDFNNALPSSLPPPASWTELWDSAAGTPGPTFSTDPESDVRINALVTSYDDATKDHGDIVIAYNLLVDFKNGVENLKITTK